HALVESRQQPRPRRTSKPRQGAGFERASTADAPQSRQQERNHGSTARLTARPKNAVAGASLCAPYSTEGLDLATEALALQRPLANGPTWEAVDSITGPRDPRVNFGGTRVHQVDVATAVERMREFAISGRSHRVVTVNLDFLSIAERDPEFRSAINSA